MNSNTRPTCHLRESGQSAAKPASGNHDHRKLRLAVAGSRVALFGGYGPDCDRLALAELSAGRARPTDEYRVVLPDGEPFPQGTRVIGRGSRLHFLTSTSWYQLDVDDIPA